MPVSKNHRPRKPRRQRLDAIRYERISSYRLKFVFALLSIGLFGLMSRMAWLQLIRTSVLHAEARANQIQRVRPPNARRSIVDRNGRLIALDEQRFRLWAHPNNSRFP